MDVMSIIGVATPLALAFITLVIVLAKMHSDIETIKEKIKDVTGIDTLKTKLKSVGSSTFKNDKNLTAGELFVNLDKTSLFSRGFIFETLCSTEFNLSFIFGAMLE